MNTEGTSNNGNSDVGTRRKNRIPDQGGPPNGTQSNKPRTTVKKYDHKGNVQKEFNKGHGKDWPNKKERTDHIHDYKKAGDSRSRMPGRKPKRNELKKDFGL